MVAFIQNVGPWQLAIVLVIVLILFGAGKLPQVFEAFGKGVKSFRDAQREDPIDANARKQLERDPQLSDADEVRDAAETRAKT